MSLLLLPSPLPPSPTRPVVWRVCTQDEEIWESTHLLWQQIASPQILDGISVPLSRVPLRWLRLFWAGQQLELVPEQPTPMFALTRLAHSLSGERGSACWLGSLFGYVTPLSRFLVRITPTWGIEPMCQPRTRPFVWDPSVPKETFV